MNKNEDRVITIFYGGNDNKDTQTLAFAKSEGLAVREVDVTKDKLTGTQLLQLADKLNVELENLLDKTSEDFNSSLINGVYDKEGWMNLILRYPQHIKTPIVQKGKLAFFVNTPSDTLKVNQINK